MTAPVNSRDRGVASEIPSPTWQISLLYDGECPLCLREVNFLRKKDAGRGLVNFVDIADEAYDPAANGGVSFEAAMGRIHAVLPDGQILQNVAVFRRVYQILGMGWIYAPTGWPVIGPIVDALYALWARWRLRLTGRPNLAELVAARHQRSEVCRPEGRCCIEAE